MEADAPPPPTPPPPTPPSLLPVWYVHLQKFFVPYEEPIQNLLEEDFQSGLPRSRPFRAQNHTYFLDFESFAQHRHQREDLYRSCKRIVYRQPQPHREGLPSEIGSQKLAISFTELKEIGAHVQNYLTREQIEQGQVPDWFENPHKHLIVETK
jgi:hypothetical protein